MAEQPPGTIQIELRITHRKFDGKIVEFAGAGDSFLYAEEDDEMNDKKRSAAALRLLHTRVVECQQGFPSGPKPKGELPPLWKEKER